MELRRLKVISAGSTDILVVGGGPAGLAAAWAAAREGVDVALVERNGVLGGAVTATLEAVLMSYRTQSPRRRCQNEARLFPPDAGDGRQVVAGFVSQLATRLVHAGAALPPSPETGYVLPTDPDGFVNVATDMIEEVGVKLLFHATACGVTCARRVGKATFDGKGGFVTAGARTGGKRVEKVIFDTKAGFLALGAKIVIDCTGDGDVAVRAGAPFEVGRKEDGLTQPMTLYFIVGGFDRMRFRDYVTKHPEQWQGVYGLWDLVEEATQAGDLDLQREDILMFGMPQEDEVLMDSTRIVKVCGLDPWDLSKAEIAGRRQMVQIAAFLKKYVPGFERSHIARSAFEVNVRETRRVVGDYVLTEEDVMTGHRFEDVIARGAYPIDIHNPAGKGTRLDHLPPGVAYDIPLRCLIPRNTANMLVAGRCISGTHEAFGSYRVAPIGMATGQAAGICAALAVKQERNPRDVQANDVQKVLLNQGVVLS